MHEQPLALDDDERTASQPVEQFVAVGRLEDRRERVVPMRLRVAGGDGQQMEIVVAEDGDRRIAQRLHFAQRGERIGSAIDDIADEPQPVLARREADQLEQLAELGVAALDVADRVEAHGNLRTPARRRC